MPTYKTPSQLAEMAEELRSEEGDSHYDIADELDVSRPAVSAALQKSGTRYIKLLARILSLYNVDVNIDPRYPVENGAE